MKLRSDGIRLGILGLVLAVLVMATPVWASVPEACQSETAHSGEVFGISLPPWLGDLWDSIRAVVGAEVESEDDTYVPTLIELGDQDQLLTSEPSDSNTTESTPNINPDG